VARISELIRNIVPDGSDEERFAIATTIVAEILACSLETSPDVAEITNAVLDAHSLAWRLVTVS
jgi:hypothetical protein